MEETAILKKRVNPIKAITISFLVVILIGTLFLMMPFSTRDGKGADFVSALFTSTSATTVTGLVVKDTHDYYSPIGQAIILAMIQIGGLGYMTLMSFIFIFGRNLRLIGGAYMQESMNLPSIGDIYKFARNTAVFVLLFELAGAAVLSLAWKGSMGTATALKYGLFHSVSAFNNSGFDLFGRFQSMAGYVSDARVNAIIMALTIIGGLGFIVMNELLHKLRNRQHKVSVHSKVVLTTSATLLIIGTVAFYLLESGNSHTLGSLEPAQKVMAAAFHSTIARSSGFATLDVGTFGTATLLLLTILMLIGSSPGGTGGGIKTTTAAVAWQAVKSFATGKSDTELFGRRLSNTSILKALAIIVASLGAITASTFAISVLEKMPLEKIVFEVTSAFGTVGLSTGITPGLTTASKFVLAAVMLIGRIGPLALLHLLMARRATQRTRLPEEDVMIG